MANTFRRVQPGFYQGPDGELHIDVPEMLQHYGILDTPANREMLTQVAAELCRERWPDARMTVLDTPLPKDS
jgi:hypothetical protein